MQQYLTIINDILYGPHTLEKATRTGINTISLSGVQFEHDMRNGFPLLTTKKMGIKSIAAELEFFIKGLSDKRWLQERGCTIWDEWANPKKVNEELEKIKFIPDYRDKWSNPESPVSHFVENIDVGEDELRKVMQKAESDLGRIYGVQWRDWQYFKWNGHFDENSIVGSYQPGHLDQLKTVIERAKKNPLDRRLLVTAWRPDEMEIVDYRTDDELYEDYLKEMKKM